MPDPNHFDPERVGSIVGLIGAFIGAVLWPFKVFQTRKSADEKFVKKVEPDGSRTYVHMTQWQELNEKLDKHFEQGEKWQKIAKDWVERP